MVVSFTGQGRLNTSVPTKNQPGEDNKPYQMYCKINRSLVNQPHQMKTSASFFVCPNPEQIHSESQRFQNLSNFIILYQPHLREIVKVS